MSTPRSCGITLSVTFMASAIRRDPHYMGEEFSYEELHCLRHINKEKARSFAVNALNCFHFAVLSLAYFEPILVFSRAFHSLILDAYSRLFWPYLRISSGFSSPDPGRPGAENYLEPVIN